MLKKLFPLLLIIIVVLCGCKSEKEISSDVSSANSGSSLVDASSSVLVSSEEMQSQNGVSSAVSGESSQKENANNDSVDPQNTENPNGIGAKVDAEKLTVKTGKANGIDVSKWQGKIDWKTVKSSGIDFAIIRIGYRAENGTIYKDANADYNIQQADKAGILIGVYFFSTAINETEAVKEAEWTVNAIKSYPISYPVVYDCEGYADSDSRMKSLTNGQRTNNALAFLGEIAKSGYEGMFYGAKSQLEFSAYWDTPRIESKYKIWVAHYSSVTYPKVETPDYSGKFDMWQYTNMGSVKGIKGNTDLVVSYFTKTKAAPKSNTAPQTATAPVEKDSVYTGVNETVTAKEVVNLRETASTGSKIVGTFKNGEKLTRTAVGTNGWSKLTYNGKTVYAISSYLTTDLTYKTPVSQPSDGYTAVEEKVTAKDVVNLRDAAGTDSNVVGKLKNGEVAVRIGVNSTNGWSKLTYNGQTVYAITSYLTTDLNYKPQTSSSQPVGDGFTEVNQQVTAKTTTNLRTKPTTNEGSEVVYTLNNGEYVTRIGINEASGWSKISYNGQTLYAVSSYLIQKSETNEN